MEQSVNWMNAMSACVLIIVAIFVIIFSAIAVSRVNGYKKQFEGIDLVPEEDWSSVDDPNSGVNRIKGVQNFFVASLVANLVLAALVTFILYKLFGAPAAVVYAVCLFLGLIYGFVTLYYLGLLGKNRMEGVNGDVDNGTETDVNHTFLSSTNMNLAFMIVHAILAIALGVYFVVKRKTVKADQLVELVEAVTGKGRHCTTADGAACDQPMRHLPGAGRSYWASVDRPRC
jgi:F0F1-type ATP synthase assembly protein I